jgi:magnesium chelatase subunit I
MKLAREFGGLSEAMDRLGAEETPATVASVLEFILEGLHLNKRLNKERVAGKIRYQG